MPWFAWLLAAAEFFTLTLVLGLLAGAALVAGVGIGLLGQLVALALAAAAGLVIVRPVALRHMAQSPITHEGSDVLIGRRAEVMREVTATHGLVKVSGEEWSARALDESHVILVGALVDVMEIDGATAVVYPRGREGTDDATGRGPDAPGVMVTWRDPKKTTKRPISR